MTQGRKERKSPQERMEVEREVTITSWETGPPDGRGVYERGGRYGSHLRFIGIMDSDDYARHVVSRHNAIES